MNIALLDRKLKAVCPVQGVSVGRWDDKSTWRVDYSRSATAEQRAAAMEVVNGFDPEAPENAVVDLKARARAKLVAAGLLTAEEADAL